MCKPSIFCGVATLSPSRIKWTRRAAFCILSLSIACTHSANVVTVEGERSDVKGGMTVINNDSRLMGGQFVVMPVGMPRGKGFASLSFYFPGASSTHNLKLVNLETGETNDAFDRPVWIADWQSSVDKDGRNPWKPKSLLVVAYCDDSNGDRRIDQSDRRSLYYVEMVTGATKDLLPPQYAYSSRFLRGDDMVVTVYDRRGLDKGTASAVGVIDRDNLELRLIAEGIRP